MLKTIFTILALSLANIAFAQAPSLELNKCFADKTTGKDRKDLARWFFASMATHPEIRDMVNAQAGIADQTSRTMGELVTRLFSKDCAKESQAVFLAEGGNGLDKSFETLGQLAMREIMSNSEVVATFTNFQRYIDQGKINSVINQK